jgi:hypothetical protein
MFDQTSDCSKSERHVKVWRGAFYIMGIPYTKTLRPMMAVSHTGMGRTERRILERMCELVHFYTTNLIFKNYAIFLIIS